MSTLWTPGGERPIRRDPTGRSRRPRPAGPGSAAATGQPAAEPSRPRRSCGPRWTELREQLARTPAEVVIANHAFGLFELAALHLSLQPPQLDQARLAIDALAALVDGLAGRLGDAEPQLSEGLSQLRMAYVQIHRASQAVPATAVPATPARTPAMATDGAGLTTACGQSRVSRAGYADRAGCGCPAAAGCRPPPSARPGPAAARS